MHNVSVPAPSEQSFFKRRFNHVSHWFCEKKSSVIIIHLLVLALLYVRSFIGFGGRDFLDFLVLTYLLSIVCFFIIPASDRQLYFLTIPSKKTIGIAFLVGFLVIATNASIDVIFYDNEIRNPFVIMALSPLTFVTKFLLNALPEELLFRGLLWGTLRRFNLSHFSILCIQAILFWAGHWFYYVHYENPYWWISTLFAGLVFGIVAWKTKSLLASAIVHSIANMLPFVLLHAR
jgi:membrane protease YdiL (CAAX protease family)